MKLIIAGASGFVAQELLSQSLKRADITRVVALSRKPVSAPDDVGGDSNAAKLRSVVLKDYDDYPKDMLTEFQGADACIWTVGVTPSHTSAYGPEELVRICQTSTLVGLKAMYNSGVAKPFRFLYMSGVAAERNRNKEPFMTAEFMTAEYLWMRGETENQVLAFAAEHPGEVEASAAKPGVIVPRGKPITSIFAEVGGAIGDVPYVQVEDLVTAMLDQVTDGFESDALMNDDLVRLGKAAKRASS